MDRFELALHRIVAGPVRVGVCVEELASGLLMPVDSLVGGPEPLLLLPFLPLLLFLLGLLVLEVDALFELNHWRVLTHLRLQLFRSLSLSFGAEHFYILLF